MKRENVKVVGAARFRVLLVLVMAVLGAGCVTRTEGNVASGKQDGMIKSSLTSAGEAPIVLEIVPGEHYTHWKWFYIVPLKLYPTLAVWAEDEYGRFAGTLYVTKKAAEGSWIGTKERPESLPVYFGRLRAGEGKPDSVSGATLNSGSPFSLGSNLSLPPGRYRVFAEVNSSFDYNDFYSKGSTGVNGQPSLVYAGQLAIGQGEARVELCPIGKGDPAGQNGTITEGTEGLTTALRIVDRISVRLGH